MIPIRAQRSNMPLVGAHLRVHPGNGQTRGSAPTDAGILQLEIEFVSSVRKRIGMRREIASPVFQRGRNDKSRIIGLYKANSRQSFLDSTIYFGIRNRFLGGCVFSTFVAETMG